MGVSQSLRMWLIWYEHVLRKCSSVLNYTVAYMHAKNAGVCVFEMERERENRENKWVRV